MEIIYKSILKFPNYRIGNDGSIWSKARGSWKQLTAIKKRGGHMAINLYPGKKQFQIHRLVLENFLGPCPENMECCHGDGNPANNNISNLRWDTHKENFLDAVKHGSMTNWKGIPKLSKEDVENIRLEYKNSKIVMKDLATKYKVCGKTIFRIIHKQTWSHV